MLADAAADRLAALSEIAARLELPEERVEQALALDEVNRPLSLDGEFESGDDDRSRVLEQSLGVEDTGLGRAEDRLGMRQAAGSPPSQ